jgi:membrane protease YdiL (CAAX protease family)
VCHLSSSDGSHFESQAQLNHEAQTPPASVDLQPAPLSAPIISPPVENPVWSGWDVLAIAALTFVTLVLIELVIALGAMRYVYPGTSLAEIAQKPILALVSEFLAYITVAFFMVALVEGKYHVRFWDAIRWKWPHGEWGFLAIGVVMLFGLNIVEHFLPMPKSVPFDKFFERPMDAYLTSVFAVSLGPLMEELFFRGFLYPVLARRVGMLWGILLTALPFGLLHAFQFGNAWSAVFVIFIVGVVLTSVRAVTKSVGASFLVHVGYNGTLMLLAAVQTGGFRHMEKAALL